MTIDSIVTEKFLNAMESGNNLPDIRNRLEKLRASEQKNEFILPILGVQGAGKSSFLNALLFNNRILPTEVTETTCIPTEVYYSDSSEPEAWVYFTDGLKKKIPCTDESLKEYVHQEFNPGNCKGVVRVVIRLKHDLLKTGLVIVDLPGVGSGTVENQQQTMDYLQKSSGGIFLLAESLKTPDAIFISTALPLLGNVFFVQNRWTGETADETQEAADYNHSILLEKVNELKIPVSQIPQFNIVSVEKALNSIIMDNPAEFAKSGMLDFQKSLIEFSDSWRKDMQKLHLEQLQNLIVNQINQINTRIQTMKNDSAPEREKLIQRQAAAEKEFAENEALIREAEDFMRGESSSVAHELEEWIGQVRGDLRTAVRNLIESGVTSGEQLNSAFHDYVIQQNNFLYENVYRRIMEITAGIRERLVALDSNREFKKISMSEDNPFSDKTQIHSVYEPAAGSLGGLAGGFGGAALVGAIWGSSAGPIGTAIGAVAGAIIGGIAGLFAGKGAKHIHVKAQQSEAQKELFAAVQDCCTKFRKNYSSALNSYFTRMKKDISAWYDVRKQAVQKEIKALLADVDRSDAEKTAKLRELAEQEQILKDALKNFQEKQK